MAKAEKLDLHKEHKAEYVAPDKPAPVEVQPETIREGRCVQMLHVGPYGDEPRTIAQMKALAEQQGLALKGPHHEIYLSDPRRVAPGRLKTILRYPVKWESGRVCPTAAAKFASARLR